MCFLEVQHSSTEGFTQVGGREKARDGTSNFHSPSFNHVNQFESSAFSSQRFSERSFLLQKSGGHHSFFLLFFSLFQLFFPVEFSRVRDSDFQISSPFLRWEGVLLALGDVDRDFNISPVFTVCVFFVFFRILFIFLSFFRISFFFPTLSLSIFSSNFPLLFSLFLLFSSFLRCFDQRSLVEISFFFLRALGCVDSSELVSRGCFCIRQTSAFETVRRPVNPQASSVIP